MPEQIVLAFFLFFFPPFFMRTTRFEVQNLKNKTRESSIGSIQLEHNIVDTEFHAKSNSINFNYFTE